VISKTNLADLKAMVWSYNMLEHVCKILCMYGCWN